MLFLCGVALITEHTCLPLTPFDNMRELESKLFLKRGVGEYHLHFSEETRTFCSIK